MRTCERATASTVAVVAEVGVSFRGVSADIIVTVSRRYRSGTECQRLYILFSGVGGPRRGMIPRLPHPGLAIDDPTGGPVGVHLYRMNHATITTTKYTSAFQLTMPALSPRRKLPGTGTTRNSRVRRAEASRICRNCQRCSSEFQLTTSPSCPYFPQCISQNTANKPTDSY
jgi:hypothetical protein